jgi:4-carboxymuconolactone decarboxylase
VYAFSTELQQNKGVSDLTWSRAIELFGEQGVIDLIGINGYYSFLSMVMNASRTAVPASTAAPLPPLAG